MRPRLAIVLLAVAMTTGLIAGCGIVPLPCDISIAALATPDVRAGDPLPDDRVIIAGPGDVDPDATSVIVDERGSSIQLRLRGDAAVRLAAHTAGHPGEFLVIAVNDTVVSVAMIGASIQGGAIEITLADAEVPEVSEQLAGCVR